MRVPGLFLYFPLIFLAGLVVVYYRADRFLVQSRAAAQALKNNFWAFLCFFVVGVNSLFIFEYSKTVKTLKNEKQQRNFCFTSLHCHIVYGRYCSLVLLLNYFNLRIFLTLLLWPQKLKNHKAKNNF